VIVREFRVRQGCAKDFELVFAAGGVWADLLQSRSQGYVATELKLLDAEERRYEVRDLWRSHSSFEGFRDAYQSDIEKFRDWLASKELVEQEIFLGGFYVKRPDEGDEAGLIPA